MQISGAFVYQPPIEERGAVGAAGFAIVLNLQNDDGTPVFPAGGDLPRNAIGAVVVLSYPQTGVWPLDVTARTGGYGPVSATGVFSAPDYPPAGWMPAALTIFVNEFPAAVVTAALPAVPDSGIEQIEFPQPRSR